ncbi:sulfotransferase [Sphingomonas sp. YL-JM2C]
MTPRPLVHIGYHKTATTWFQRCFYPRVEGRRYVPQPLVRRALLDPHALHFDPATARRLLGDGLDTAILCEENLSGGLHNGGLAGCLSKDVAARIRATLPDARIVVVVRRQADAIASAYVQYVKGGGTHGVERYLFGRDYLGPHAPEHDEVPRFRFEHFAYDRLIALYDDLFGRENVHVYRYEELRADPPGFIRAFMAEHGLAAPVGDIDFDPANRGLGRLLLRAVRLANRFTARAVADKSCLVHLPYWYKISRRLMRKAAAGRLAGRPATAETLLGPALLAEIERRFQMSNAALDRRIGGRRWATMPPSDARVAPPSRWRRICES